MAKTMNEIINDIGNIVMYNEGLKSVNLGYGNFDSTEEYTITNDIIMLEGRESYGVQGEYTHKNSFDTYWFYNNKKDYFLSDKEIYEFLIEQYNKELEESKTIDNISFNELISFVEAYY